MAGVKPMTLVRRAAAETVGTAFLLAMVVGSGVMAERLAAGNGALALLANSLATGAGLVALILTFGSVSGGHFNPAVTLATWLQGERNWKQVLIYIISQLFGALVGVVAAHLMFGEPLLALSRQVRSGGGQVFSEVVATFGLLSVICGVERSRPRMLPFAIGAYITAAYWFTASTSFANPAVTLARAFTHTFSGIRLADAPGFIFAQLVAAAAATIFIGWLIPGSRLSQTEGVIDESDKGVDPLHR